MIGLPIGLAPIGGIFVSSSLGLAPNIILSGTLDFGTSYRMANRVNTFLNFGVITNDDNIIQVNLTNTLTGLPITIESGVINFYLPNTDSLPVITKSAILGIGNFLFQLSNTDIVDLPAGLYSWVAVVTLSDRTQHTVNCGDINLTTGIMRVVGRP